MTDFNWKSSSQLILIKILGAVMAALFLSLASLFLSYCFFSVASTIRGADAKILAYSGQVGNFPTACRFGGFYDVTVETEKKKSDKIRCFYPAWPDMLQPATGDIIRIWPADKPVIGAVPLDGWGWFIVGTLLVVGFIMVEFAFLSLTIR